MAKFKTIWGFITSMVVMILLQPKEHNCEVKSHLAVRRCGYDFLQAYINCCQNVNQCRTMGDVKDKPGKKIACSVPFAREA